MNKRKPTCDQCAAARINGVFCHEHGCPNSGKVWEAWEWIKYYKCFVCGEDVSPGDECRCEMYMADEVDFEEVKGD